MKYKKKDFKILTKYGYKPKKYGSNIYQYDKIITLANKLDMIISVDVTKSFMGQSSIKLNYGNIPYDKLLLEFNGDGEYNEYILLDEILTITDLNKFEEFEKATIEKVIEQLNFLFKPILRYFNEPR